MNNSESTLCPNVTELLLNEPVGTAIGQRIGIVISVVGLLFATCTFALFTVRRNVTPAKEHPYYVIAIQYAGLILCFAAYPLQDAVGRSVYPCTLLLVSRLLWLFLNQGPLTGMVFIVYSQLLLQSRMRAIKKFTPEAMLDKLALRHIDSERAKIRTLKFRYGYRGAIAFALFVTICCVLLFVAYAPKFQEFAPGCQGCEMEDIDTYVLGGVGVFFIGLMMYCNARAYLLDIGDSSYIMRESLQATLNWLIVVVIFFPFWLLDPGNLDKNRYFSWYNFVSIACCIAFGCNVLNPALRTFSKPVDVEEITLSDVLSTAEGEELFEEHLMREFSVEHIKFYKDATKWRDSFQDPAVDSSSATGMVQRHGRWIYDTYVSPRAVLAINLSDETAQAIRYQFGSDASVTVAPNVYDTAINEVYRLMELDSFDRFLRSSIGKDFMKRMYNNRSMADRPGGRGKTKSRAVQSRPESNVSQSSVGNLSSHSVA